MSTVELDIGDKLEVVEVEGGQVTITTPSTLSQGLIGGVVTVQGDRQGVIHQVGEDNITLLSDAQFQLNEGTHLHLETSVIVFQADFESINF